MPPFTGAEFLPISHKDVPAAITDYIAALKDVVFVVAVPSGGYLFFFG